MLIYIESVSGKCPMFARVIIEATKIFASAAIKTIRNAVVGNRMTSNEARQILGVGSECRQEELESRFKSYYEINDKSAGGSPYLQRKIKEAYTLLKKQPVC